MEKAGGILAVDQSSYATKIIVACIVSDLDNWPNILPRNYTFKNFLFGATRW